MSRDLTHLMRSLFLPMAEHFRELAWQPAVDVYRTTTGWLVKAELAGVRPEDVDVRIGDSHLVIRGRRRDWSCESTASCHRLEITYSDFERTLELPTDLRHAHIATDYQYGLLIIHIELETPP
jgi:HSP20 family protein